MLLLQGVLRFASLAQDDRKSGFLRSLRMTDFGFLQEAEVKRRLNEQALTLGGLAATMTLGGRKRGGNSAEYRGQYGRIFEVTMEGIFRDEREFS